MSTIRSLACLTGARFVEAQHFIDRTILIIEDDPNIAHSLQELFADAGAHVLEAQSLARGLELADNPRLDAAVVDWRLGTGDAGEICGALVKRGVPFCFLTGDVVIPARWDDVPLLVKPVGGDHMLAVVRRLLREPERPAGWRSNDERRRAVRV